ncbi:ROK family protein [Promicromonospora thailandica]|uniref:Sugar kinase of the NBD/HSP70 family, may containing an N-terminal HTH domain n=1 Tax=Promicromonospora thailandica TaxID=765201 RepID=A0A9X2FZA0_9MICO|nr:ROK family transcriptional regulator [Promicromonospora thailandica]MCP2263210.1 Sugar kinase of the NBD/HSP70 family, may containing an N-terminal HTH domain [Promicromonospora thailandica]BFF18598.1 ROK family protein [Promicromonospora thailandica]
MAQTARPRVSAARLEREIVVLVSSGRARSRKEIADALGLAPSTVSQRVQALLASGDLEETGEGESSGGRRPRALRVPGSTGYLGVVDVGGAHARLGILRHGGELVATTEIPLAIADGPEAVLAQATAALRDLAGTAADGGRLLGAGISLPGPVDVAQRALDSPSRMPGWSGFDVGSWLEDALGVPAVVENDANAMAVGEHFGPARRTRHSVSVKAGTAIGAGILVDDRLYRGAGGAAGDITHTRIPAGGDTPCTCGNRGCLETVASGAALVRLLREQGYDVTATADVLTLVRDADPVATTLARTAGRHLGAALCTVVNFFNPGAVYLGGALSTLEPFVSAIRSQIYEGAHPLMTRDLVIAPSGLGPDANLVGVGRLLEDTLVPHAFTRPPATPPAMTPAMTPEGTR